MPYSTGSYDQTDSSHSAKAGQQLFSWFGETKTQMNTRYNQIKKIQNCHFILIFFFLPQVNILKKTCMGGGLLA